VDMDIHIISYFLINSEDYSLAPHYKFYFSGCCIDSTLIICMSCPPKQVLLNLKDGVYLDFIKYPRLNSIVEKELSTDATLVPY
jgi:hypothetical protein